MLEKSKGKRVLVAFEGVYSMDGDLVRLPEILEVCEHYKAATYIDEAHSTLMFGPNGRGVAEHFGLEHKIGMSFGTLSKSFGGVGGFVCSNASIIDYLKGYSSPWNFSCAPSPPVVAGLMKALEVATRDSSLRDALWSNVAYLKKGLLGPEAGPRQERIPGDPDHHRLIGGEAHPVRLRDPEARALPPAGGLPGGPRGFAAVPHLRVVAVHQGADGHRPHDHRGRDRQGPALLTSGSRPLFWRRAMTTTGS